MGKIQVPLWLWITLIVWGILSLILIIGSIIGYSVILHLFSNQGASNSAGTSQIGNQTKDFNGGITSVEFQVFPAGTKVQRGMNGTVTNIFKSDDLVTISGKTDIDNPIVLTIKIFNQRGDDLGTAWHGNEIKIQQPKGSFEFGTITIPQTSGNYTLTIYFDNYKVKDMPFQVLSTNSTNSAIPPNSTQGDCSSFASTPNCSWINDPQGAILCKQCFPNK